MTEERRNDIELQVIAERLDNLKTQVERSDSMSLEWRGQFCRKLDIITAKIDALPCPSRNEHTKGIDQHIRALWIAVSAVFLGIAAEWIKTR